MNIQLIHQPKPFFTPAEQVLYNRGITNIEQYLSLFESTDDSLINDFKLLGEGRLLAGAQALCKTVQENKKALIIVDCDCDGYTSSALLINYLYKIFPTWTKNNLTWWMHDSKQHGLEDCIEKACEYDLVICPDSASNDYEEHKILYNKNIPCIVLDHHLADVDPGVWEYAIIINNQLSSYPNKELSGVGVVWQFCRYLDTLLHKDYANDFIDLVALGNCGDMMSLKSFETRYLILKGFRSKNIKNPFIEYMIDKNNYSLSGSDYKPSIDGQEITSMGAAFYIVPFINAVTRSGTIDEKKLVFKSMLDYEAFQMIPEIKRNKLTGNKEKLVLQAVRVVTNVKKRQKNFEDAGLVLLEQKIKEENLLDHKILLFLLESDEIAPEIRGLCANKMMAKYQRPCAILTKGDGSYNGSMRGYTKCGLNSFKDLLETCPGVLYCQGHDNAAGLGISADKINDFIVTSDNKLSGMPSEPIYSVDFILDANDPKTKDIILSIASMNDFWGQDIDRAYVGIKFKINSDNLTVMKANTLKITLGDLSIIKFKATDEEIAKLTTTGWIEIEAYCKCNCNNWNGINYPQLILEEYEIIDSCKYMF